MDKKPVAARFFADSRNCCVLQEPRQALGAHIASFAMGTVGKTAEG